MQMPRRNGGEDYRYGFNGLEHDPEVSGDGNSYTTFFRQLDTRLGRWKTIDPKASAVPAESPYCSMANNPIVNTDVLRDQIAGTIRGRIAFRRQQATLLRKITAAGNNASVATTAAEVTFWTGLSANYAIQLQALTKLRDSEVQFYFDHRIDQGETIDPSAYGSIQDNTSSRRADGRVQIWFDPNNAETAIAQTTSIANSFLNGEVGFRNDLKGDYSGNELDMFDQIDYDAAYQAESAMNVDPATMTFAQGTVAINSNTTPTANPYYELNSTQIDLTTPDPGYTPTTPGQANRNDGGTPTMLKRLLYDSAGQSIYYNPQTSRSVSSERRRKQERDDYKLNDTGAH
jgi:hypothetical protein